MTEKIFFRPSIKKQKNWWPQSSFPVHSNFDLTYIHAPHRRKSEKVKRVR